MNLDPFCEIIGTIENVDETESGTKITFTFQKKIDLPLDPCEFQLFIGKQVRIFNNDGNYIIRECEK